MDDSGLNSGAEARCALCDSPRLAHHCTKNAHAILRCEDCQYLFVHPRPNHLADIYSEDYFEGASHGFGFRNYEREKLANSHVFAWLLDRIEGWLPNKGCLLDVGTAMGVFLSMAAARGWTASGLDVSGYASAAARHKGLDVRSGTLQDHRWAVSQFDAVTYLDVFEHLSDPRAELSTLRELIRPGGLLVINTPNTCSLVARVLRTRWHHFVPPEHLQWYSPQNLQRLLAEYGFEVLQKTDVVKKFSVEYIAQTMANVHGSRVAWAIARCVSGTRAGALMIGFLPSDNMLVVARRDDTRP